MEYTSASCNRVPHVLDWGKNGILAYGSSHAVVLAKLESNSKEDCILHIRQVLAAHTGRVNCVHWLKQNKLPESGDSILISTAADKKAIFWQRNGDAEFDYKDIITLTGEGVGNLVDGLQCTNGGTYIVCGSDAKASIWFSSNGLINLKLEHTLNFGSSFILDVRLHELEGSKSPILAFGCSDSKVHLYGYTNAFERLTSLKGHEDWVRGLDFTTDGNGDTLLASCSQDSYVRLWRISHLEEKFESDNFLVSNFTVIEIPANDGGQISFSVSLDSVLSGHENWTYAVHWEPQPMQSPPRLLTCSMDKTMIMWMYDSEAQIWLDKVRVGEVGGNSLGFYGNTFSPDSKTILAYGFNGAFHLWTCDEANDKWEPGVSCGGHFGEVVDLAWSPTGNYLLSTSTDQTTRLHAPWVRKGKSVTWHEVARPQVHGYDLSCLAIIDQYHFASGAEEKVIRVFQAPTNFLENFERLSLVKEAKETLSTVPQGASVPALGLSNKPVYESNMMPVSLAKGDQYPEFCFTPTVLTRPPTEETLLQYTLWPEIHKLYGHGNELFALASEPHGQLLVSASKAARPQDAHILVWDTNSWTKIDALEGHTLTVTQLAFSPNGQYLLSVSRDRTWGLYSRQTQDNRPTLVPAARTLSGSRVHSRIIWCCDWSPDSRYFITGSRDRKLVVWSLDAVLQNQGNEGVLCQQTMEHPITAVAFAPFFRSSNQYYVGVGFENGTISIYDWTTDWTLIHHLDKSQSHHLSVKRLRFRPPQCSDEPCQLTMASAGADGFVRIHNLNITTAWETGKSRVDAFAALRQIPIHWEMLNKRDAVVSRCSTYRYDGVLVGTNSFIVQPATIEVGLSPETRFKNLQYWKKRCLDMEEYSDKDFSDPANRSENRKSNKPIMEKRRRARINYCLNELKSLILDAMKKDPARHSKLEKADILEMTVKHLQSVQRQQLAMAVSSDPSVLSKFKNGFSECASEVSRYVSRIDGVDQGVCQRMISHLIRCMSGIQTPHGLNPVNASSSVLILPNYPGRSSLSSDFLHPPPLPDANFHTRLLTSLKAMQHFGDVSSFFPTLRESQGNVPPNIPTTPTTCTAFNVVGNKSAEYSAFLPVKRPRSPSPLREKKPPNKSLKLTIPEERCDTFSTNNNVVEKANHSVNIPRRNIPTPPSSPVAEHGGEPSSTDMWRPW